MSKIVNEKHQIENLKQKVVLKTLQICAHNF